MKRDELWREEDGGAPGFPSLVELLEGLLLGLNSIDCGFFEAVTICG